MSQWRKSSSAASQFPSEIRQLSPSACPSRISVVPVSSVAGEPTDPEHSGNQDGPYVPRSHPVVERLIGTVRREYLDRLLFWTAADLERKLVEFQQYYNEHRTHTGRAGRPPGPSPDTVGARASLRAYRWQPHCRGLYQTPRAARRSQSATRSLQRSTNSPTGDWLSPAIVSAGGV